jgi:hypothetical protein
MIGKHFRAFLRSCFPYSDIVKVTVRDPQFQVIKEIDGGGDLAAFRRMWDDRVEADPGLWKSAGQAHYGHGAYKLDIRRAKSSSRWHYHPSGLTKVLAIWRSILVAPLYRLRTPPEFNKLVGIPL